MNACTSFKVTLGIGCDRGTSQETIASAIAHALSAAQLNHTQVAGIASITLKADEAGLLACAAHYNWPIRFFSPAELAGVSVPNPSPVVLQHTGTPSVSEAAALLLAQQSMQALLLEKFRWRGSDGRHATVSIARITP